MNELTTILADTAERIFNDPAPSPAGACDMSTWTLVEEAAIDRLLLPEDLGGAGNAVDAAVQIAQRFGARCCAIPFIETLVANRWLWEAGVEVDPGPKTVALPITSPAVTWALDDALIVCCDGSIVPTDEALAGPLRSNLAAEPVRCLTPEWATRCSQTVSESGLALYATLKSSAIAGALHAALEMTLRYVSERTQFGRKIAAFQAVQHMVACMAEEVAAATAAVQMASRQLGSRNQLYFAAAAKSRVAEAATAACALAHQCHGAIGYTREHSLHRLTHRALAWRDDAGGEEYWNERIGRAALASSGGQLWQVVLEGARLP
jgi:acyl-CoA dehydrogenase